MSDFANDLLKSRRADKDNDPMSSESLSIPNQLIFSDEGPAYDYYLGNIRQIYDAIEYILRISLRDVSGVKYCDGADLIEELFDTYNYELFEKAMEIAEVDEYDYINDDDTCAILKHLNTLIAKKSREEADNEGLQDSDFDEVQ